MSQSTGPFSLTLNVLVQTSPPGGSGVPLPASVQLQNATPFTLTVLAAGLQYEIAQFTAQTIPLAEDNAPITVTPTAGPGGSNAGLTVVWLNPGEVPPMADGQLTGAAQYAEGLGSVVFGPAAVADDGSGNFLVDPVALPPVTRTVLILVQSGNSTFPSSVFVAGFTTGYRYRQAIPPYLRRLVGMGTYSFVVVPVAALPDSAIAIQWANAHVTSPNTLTVWADTAQYDESVFYNGAIQEASQSLVALGGVNVVAGPARLLTADLTVLSAGTTAEIEIGSTPILRADTSAGGKASTVFPLNTILPTGSTLSLQQVTAGQSQANVTFAYP